MRPLLALLALLAFTATATATAAAAAPSRCHVRKDERLVAHSKLAVVSYAKGRARVEGCLRRTGARRVLYRAGELEDWSEDVAKSVELVGAQVV